MRVRLGQSKIILLHLETGLIPSTDLELKKISLQKLPKGLDSMGASVNQKGREGESERERGRKRKREREREKERGDGERGRDRQR